MESLWVKQMAKCPCLLWKTVSRSGVMNAARSLSINHQRCEDTNKKFLILSLLIHFFDWVVNVDAAVVHSRRFV